MSTTVKLADLPTGHTAVIASLPSGVPSLTRLREMGVLPGTKILLVRRAPLGDPLEISVRGSLLSLRRQETELIEVHPEA
ncbi:MAG: Fe(2+) transport protein A [Verrucomicrobia subdivision 3 bacterium]|nr:Fe(2+) transport protein A [Limisphaerales bacterium]MCS1416181.1 Fe(2+) transport protein A [Limisphaerales bacterium]